MKRERALEAGLVPVVEEEAADAARLVAVLDGRNTRSHQFLQRVYSVRAERLARGPGRAMPVQRVLVARVIRRQVETAAEPPHRLIVRRVRDDEAHVGVRGRHVRIARMYDERHTHGFEGSPGELGSAEEVAEAGSCPPRTCEKLMPACSNTAPLRSTARLAAAALGAAPGIAAETSRAIRGFDAQGQRVVQAAQVRCDVSDG